jgi:hypothetical protein
MIAIDAVPTTAPSLAEPTAEPDSQTGAMGQPAIIDHSRTRHARNIDATASYHHLERRALSDHRSGAQALGVSRIIAGQLLARTDVIFGAAANQSGLGRLIGDVGVVLQRGDR